MPVSGAQTWLVVPGLEPGAEYQFSVLAQNKLGTGPFSEVVTVNTTGEHVIRWVLVIPLRSTKEANKVTRDTWNFWKPSSKLTPDGTKCTQDLTSNQDLDLVRRGSHIHRPPIRVVQLRKRLCLQFGALKDYLYRG